MAEFQIMSKDGSAVRASGALVYNGTYLKPGYVEFQEIASPIPILWEAGDYVDYPRTGLRYKLYTTPKSLKQGEQNRYGGSFVYENVQFFDATKDIELAPFIDLVPYDNLVHFSTLNTVSFVGAPANVAERIQACLNHWYPGTDWVVKVVSDLDPIEDADLLETLSTEAEFSVSGVNCLQVLEKVYETWNGLGWSFSVEGDVNTITIGAPNKRTASNTTDLYSRIGDNGLTAIARSVSNAEEMGTRLYAYGSSRNIPTDYYRSKNIKDAESVDIEHLMIPINPVASLDYDGWGLTDGVPDARLAYIEDEVAVSKYGLIPRYAYFDGSDPSLPEIFPSIEGVTIGDVIDAKAQISDTSYVPSLSRWSRADRIDEVVSAVNPSDNGGSSSNGEKYAESGDYATTGGELDSSEGENPDTLEIGHFSPSSAADIVDVAVNLTGTIRLTDTTDISGVRMVVRVLAGSATATAAQEILISPQNTDTSGVYSFSLEGATTRINLTGMSYVQILVEGYKGEGGDYAAYDYHADINAGSVFLGFNSSLGNTFTATIPQIGFNLLQYADMGNGKTISMKSGMCAGRDFPIKAATYNRGTDTWQLTVGRVKDTDTGLWFPNSDFPIESGDKYVLLDIAMPELYILMGAVRLLKAAKRLLGGISSESPFYEPQIDSKRVYNENRILREGMWMHLGADEIVDGGGDYALIDTLRIDEAVSNIPVYEVMLRKKKPIEWTETINRTSTNVSSTPVEETHQTVAPTTKTLDWFIPESFEEDGETKYRLKLNPKYVGMYAEGWVSAGGVSEQGGGGGGTGYLRDLLDVNASMSPTQGQALVWDDALGKWTAGDVSVDLTPFERIANRVTTVSSSSNHTQYPTAKAVYDIVNTMLSSAMRFQGVTSTALVDGSTTNPVVVDGASYTATRGDVVVRSDVGLEYLWTGAKWQQLGDETSYAKKTVTITGSGYLTGGGNLEAARTIDIATEVKTKIDNGATAFGYFTDGAANEAIKLKTPRTIWGQSFDGSGNVVGDLYLGSNTATTNSNSDVLRFNGYIDKTYITGPSLRSINVESYGRARLAVFQHNSGDYTGEYEVLSILPNGNVGFGTNTPAYKADIVGDSRTSGKVYIGTSGGYLEVVNVGTTASPVYALKSSLPFFSDSWVSAGGVSPAGSGGGITGYLKDLLDVNGSMIPVDGQALVWDSSLGDTGKWTSKNVSIDLTPFERTTNKVTSISASSTDGQYPSAKAVYSALSTKADSSTLSGYLPLTGGTLNSGSSSPTLTLNTSAADSAIKCQQGGLDKAWIGYNAGAGVYLYNSIRSRYLSYKDDGSLLFENNKVWHAGNDGSGSGLDADLLDGWQGERYISYNQSTLGNDVDFNTISYNRGNSITIQPIHVPNYTGQTNIPVQGYGQMLTFGGQSSLFPFRIAHSSTSGSLYYQSAGYKVDETFDFSTGSPWRELAFTDSNVGSATKLQAARNFSISDATTAHTGQEVAFDGTASVVLPLPQIITANLIGTATGITENPFEDEVFAHQATPVRDIADGYRIDSIKGNTIVSDGELINNSAEAIETTGFNQWDENWEIGTYNSSTGAKESSGSQIRSKNLIPVIPGKRYYINAAYGQSICYDELINYISTTPWAYATGGYYLDIPSNAHYISFYMPIAYGTTYKNDICINLSCDRDGEYEPYRANRLALGLGSIKVKSGGNILEFNGLASAGDVYDELEGGKLIKRIGSYTLTGSESWTANGSNMYRSNFTIPRKLSSTYWGTVGNLISSRLTAATNSAVYNGAVTSAVCFTDSTSAGYIGISKDVYDNIASYVGTTIYYELATPVIYDLVSPVPLSGRIDGNGTMRVISDGPVAPFRGDITYGCNPGQMGADASSVKSYLDTMLEIKVVNGVPMLHTALPFYSDSFVSAGGLSGTGGSGSGSSLRDLSDVQLPEIITTGSALVYNGEKWVQSDATFVPQTRTVNGLELSSNISLSLGDLSNVNTAGASNGQSLIYNGSEWIAGTPAGAKFFHGTCSTSSSSNTKVVDCPSFTSADLVAGTAIAIVMHNRSDTTSTVTINVNGTGANTLLAGFANRKAWSAQELILAVYDGSGVWDMLPTWYYTYYYGGGGSGGGGGTGSTVVVTQRLSSGTRIATITVDGSATDLYAPSISVTQSQGSTGGTRIASINSTAIYAPAVTVTQVQTSGVEVARIKVGSANPVSIFAPSGSGGASGVQTVVGKTGDVTTAQIAEALTNAGYKLTDTVVDTSSFLPLSAGSGKALTGDLYTRAILPTASNTYDLGSSSKYFKNNYMKRIYLADGVYIEYDSTNRCVYVHGAGIATDSFVSAGGVSNT